MAHIMNVAAGAQPLVAPAIKSFLAKYATGSHADPVVLQRQLTLFDVINPAVARITPAETRAPRLLFVLTNESKWF